MVDPGSVFPNPTLALRDGTVWAALHHRVQSLQVSLPRPVPTILEPAKLKTR